MDDDDTRDGDTGDDDTGDDRAATIAGHPLVRALRRDAAREVWVASDASGSGVELHRSRPGEEALLAREVEALLLADHPHLVPILDVATDAGVVVVRPLLPIELSRWLLERGSPQPGEAVTALVPIAAALGALHAVGAALGGVSAQQVRLDADGAPLLLGEGARVETARPSPAWREASAAVAADAAGWRALAEAVLEASGAGLPEPVERALEALDLAAAGAALLTAWPALPLVLEPAASTTPRVGARLRQRERTAGARFGADAWARIAALLDRLVERIPTLRVPLRDVRPRFWAVAGLGAAAVAAALLLLPQGADAGDQDAAGSVAVARSAAPGASASGAPPPSAAPAPTAPPPAASEAPTTDDPVAGAALLLAEREACIDADDAACLVGLHEPDSPQLTAAQPWRMPADGRLELVQRLGDAWLLRVVSDDEPASVLVMSSEAGWTLRDAWSG